MKKIYIALFLIFLTVVVILTVLKKSKPPLPSSITPTSIYPTKIVISPPPTPTLIPVAPFTGVLEETLPQPTVDMIQQKQNLRQKTPLETGYFTITFDYGEDKFVVELKEPKEETKLKFEEWKTINYPAIPSDRFTIK